MQLIRDLLPAKPGTPGAVVAVGNFDGVHLGHQVVIDQARELAAREGLRSTIVCFEPMPREYFSRQLAPPRLTRMRRKFLQIAKRGVDQLACLRFNARMAQMTAEQFMEQVLVAALQARKVIVGADFRFGRARQGDVALLQDRAPALNFDVVIAATVQQNGERVSSTRIRQALAAGDLAGAADCLGGPFTLEGHVRHGKKIGRELGFPTANVHTGPYPLPLRGVFAGVTRLADGRRLDSAVSIGTRPVLGESGQELLEVHVLDFNEDLYGQRLEVSLHRKLRDEMNFDRLEALREQIQRDVAQARNR